MLNRRIALFRVLTLFGIISFYLIISSFFDHLTFAVCGSAIIVGCCPPKKPVDLNVQSVTYCRPRNSEISSERSNSLLLVIRQGSILWYAAK